MAVEHRLHDVEPAGLPATLSLPCPWNAPRSALPRAGKRAAGLSWGSCAAGVAGFVMGCVFLGLAGRRMRYQEKELQIIYNGE